MGNHPVRFRLLAAAFVLAMGGCAGNPIDDGTQGVSGEFVEIGGEKIPVKDGVLELTRPQLALLQKNPSAIYIQYTDARDVLTLSPSEYLRLASTPDGVFEAFYKNVREAKGRKPLLTARVGVGPLRSALEVVLDKHGYELREWRTFDFYVSKERVIVAHNLEDLLGGIVQDYPVRVLLDNEQKAAVIEALGSGAALQ